MSESTIPYFSLDNGLQIPVIGLGVFQTPPAETTAAALDIQLSDDEIQALEEPYVTHPVLGMM